MRITDFPHFQSHEEQCRNSSSSSPSSRFFSYLRLESAQGESSVSPTKVVKRPKPGSLAKFLSIDVTSPLGRSIFLRNSPKAVNGQAGEIDFKVLCQASARRETSARQLIKAANEGDFMVTTTKAHRHLKHSHQYCFNRWQRNIRLNTIRTGLSLRSRKLLRECAKLTFAVMLERVEIPSKIPPWSVYGLIPAWKVLENDRRVSEVAKEKGFKVPLQIPRLCIKPLPNQLVQAVLARRSKPASSGSSSSSRSGSVSRSNGSSRSSSPVFKPRPQFRIGPHGDKGG